MSRLAIVALQPQRGPARGQVLVLVAIMFVILLGMAGLAIDVSSAYSTRRYERSVADAASLAGAQDLQTAGTRTVTGAQRIDARTHALRSLVNQLGATSTGLCNPNANITNCALPGTPYRVSIKTPSPSCSACDPNHSVQVMIHNPSFGVTFARLFGQSTWDVGITSVAGLNFSSKYAVITLQPPLPRPNQTDANLCKDLIVNGNNTVLNVLTGDIGTNTSAVTTQAGLIVLQTSYYIDHFDDLTSASCGNGTPTWTVDANGNPQGRMIGSLIQDPVYMYPSFNAAPAFAHQSDGVIACSGANWPTDYTTVLAGAVCYRPGIYSSEFRVNTGGGPRVVYLMPGAYSFPNGMKMHGTLGAGLISNQPGVVMLFPQSQLLDPNNAVSFLLNAGGETCNADACRAAPAHDFANQQVKSPTGLTITIEVTRDPDCYNGTNPINAANCDVNQNKTVGLAGTGRLVIGGVIYAPSDNVNINGNSGQIGYVGQIVSWSVTYTGGSTLNQSYPGGAGVGILRIDAACSAPGEPCNP